MPAVELPAAALAWLGIVGTESAPFDRAARTARALTLGLVAARIPAWLEPVATALDRIGDDHDASWVRRALAGHPAPLQSADLPAAERPDLAGVLGGAAALRRLAAEGLPPVPQVVGVPLAQAGLRRAEWIDGHLYLYLVPAAVDPARRVALRLVGAEPRQWDIAGIPGVLADLSSQGLQLLIPLVEGPLELSRGSY